LEILYLKPTHINQGTYLFLRYPDQQIIKSRKSNFRIYFNLLSSYYPMFGHGT